jgi:hypothetical protein
MKMYFARERKEKLKKPFNRPTRHHSSKVNMYPVKSSFYIPKEESKNSLQKEKEKEN